MNNIPIFFEGTNQKFVYSFWSNNDLHLVEISSLQSTINGAL